MVQKSVKLKILKTESDPDSVFCFSVLKKSQRIAKKYCLMYTLIL
ncbi:hypothetical protein ELI_1048 [Eubacterium callanderi]|uniref:Uncharacterized protein n=1 Tax=Eubacterium callanderi TaxID=53442 RepID=E3GJS5_9FIRM|nr:hypothetical protein ELI_1048 [Eubacterium callanderi]